jgi:hypothetical protein
MRGIALAAALALMACGSAANPPSSSVASASRAAPSTTTSRSQALACRLPVTWTVDNGSFATRKSGFWTFPDGPVTEDQTAPSDSLFFDAAQSIWLPAPREAISANGDQYAYTDGSTDLGTEGHVHVVDLSTNADRVVYSGAVYRIVDFAPEGIYLTAEMGEAPYTGLWLLNPGGGAPRLINASVSWPAVGGGTGWAIGFDPSDPSPPPAGIGGARNLVERIDLSSGAATPWFYTEGAQPAVMGFDGRGNPFVRVDRLAPNDSDVSHDMNEVWLVTSQTSANRLFSGLGWDQGPWKVAATDDFGVWFMGWPGTWLYSQNAFRPVADPGLDNFAVAGGCLKAG